MQRTFSFLLVVLLIAAVPIRVDAAVRETFTQEINLAPLTAPSIGSGAGWYIVEQLFSGTPNNLSVVIVRGHIGDVATMNADFSAPFVGGGNDHNNCHTPWVIPAGYAHAGEPAYKRFNSVAVPASYLSPYPQDTRYMCFPMYAWWFGGVSGLGIGQFTVRWEADVTCSEIVLNTAGRSDLRTGYYHDFFSDGNADGVPDSIAKGNRGRPFLQQFVNNVPVVSLVSSNEAVGRIDNGRRFVAVAPGTCTVTATCDGISVAVPMTVLPGVTFRGGFVRVTPPNFQIDLKPQISAPASTPTNVVLSGASGALTSVLNVAVAWPHPEWGVVRLSSPSLAGAFNAEITDNLSQSSGVQRVVWFQSKPVDAPQGNAWAPDATFAIFSGGAVDSASLAALARVVDPGRASADPVIYATGETQMWEDDLESGGSAVLGWRRSYSNLSIHPQSPLGPVWMAGTQPYAYREGSVIVVVARSDAQFAFTDNGNGTYTALRGGPSVLANAGTSLAFADVSGARIVFNGFSVANPALRGMPTHAFTPGGERIAYAYDASGRLDRITRQVSATEQEQLRFAYQGDNLVERVDRCRVVGSQVTTIRSVRYVYYGGNVGEFGEKGCLKLAQVLDDAGSVVREFYYRYYRAGEAGGFAGALRSAIGPRNVARMRGNSIDPLTTTLSHAALAPYVDKAFNYDAAGRVAQQVLQTPDRDGSGTYGYAYALRASPPAVPGPNDWLTRTIETMPDGSQHVVYCNKEGQILLKASRASSGASQQFVHAYRYNALWRLEWHATPAAFAPVSGAWYDEAHTDLINGLGGNSPYVQDGSGLIERWSFYATTDPNAGAVAGYPQHESEQVGELGVQIRRRSFTYAGH